jgi:hypothetical protein
LNGLVRFPLGDNLLDAVLEDLVFGDDLELKSG